MKRYGAKWSDLLIRVSVIATIVCLGAAVVLLQVGGGMLRWAAVFPVVLVLWTALYTVVGYTIAGNEILVHRLLWATHLPLGGLSEAQYEPEAMRSAVRVMGIGGLFSWTGYYWSKRLGRYRAFVTDPRRTVVLRFGEKTVVVSPEEPEAFVKELASRLEK